MIRVEQLVYGTFPFTQGFTLASRSEGITPEIAQQAIDVCKSWGEILTPEFGGALYHVAPRTREPEGSAGGRGSTESARGGAGAGAGVGSGSRAVGASGVGSASGGGSDPGAVHLVGKVLRHGVDAGGRMAWFHQVLAIRHEDYLRAGADLFTFDDAGLFRDRWFDGDQCTALAIDAGMLPVPARTVPLAPPAQQRVAEVAAALGKGGAVRFVAQRATKAVRRLMRDALRALPDERRAEVSVATLAFRPVRRYDLWCLYEAGGGEPERLEDVAYRIER